MGMDYRARRQARAFSWLALTGLWVALAAVSVGWVRWVWLAALGLTWLVLHRWMLSPGAVPVLTYHSVSGSTEWLPWADGTSISPLDFGRQLDLLGKLGCHVVSTRDLIRARQDERVLPKRPVVLHFDDGYLDNWVAAFPLLRERQLPATIFLSLDFIEAGSEVRPRLDEVEPGELEPEDLAWEGYLNWEEIGAMRDSGLIDFGAHGVTHGRTRSGPGVVTMLRSGNWRRHAWLQWAHLPGSKVDWHRWTEPPYVPLGSQVPESRSSLVTPEWSEGGSESQEQFEQRVLSELQRCRGELEAGLGTPVDVFCWPFNESSPVSRRLAATAGYSVTTGGRGENRPGEATDVISRFHAGDRAAGWKWLWLDDLAFRGTVRLGQGNYYWYFLMAPIHLSRKLVLRLRRWLGGRSTG